MYGMKDTFQCPPNLQLLKYLLKFSKSNFAKYMALPEIDRQAQPLLKLREVASIKDSFLFLL